MADATSAVAEKPLQLYADAIKKLHPQDYYRLFTSQQVRPDARSLEQFRPVQSTTGSISTANGSALIKLGNTAVLCAIKAEVATPTPLKPDEGYFVANVELSPMCSPQFKPGAPSAKAQTLSDNLHQTLLKSRFLDLRQLCIHTGQAVWVLYADLYCLNYDGNLFDAAILALMTALSCTKLPEATFDDDEGTVRASRINSRKLQLQRIPLACTFAVFDGKLLADPTSEEESLKESQISVICDDEQKLCGLLKGGGSPLTLEQTQECVQRAHKQYAVIKSTLHL